MSLDKREIRVLVVGDESSIATTGLSYKDDLEIDLVGSLAEAVAKQGSYNHSEVIIDSDVSNCSDIEILADTRNLDDGTDGALTPTDTATNSADTTTDIIESIRDSLFCLDREWRFTRVNSEAERQFQKLRQELVGHNIWELFPQAIGTAYWEHYHRSMNEQTPASFESYYPPRDIWTEVRVYPTNDGIAVFCLDISERKRNEQAIRDGEQRMALASRAAHIGVWEWNPQADCSVLNDQCLDIYGFGPDEFPTYDQFLGIIHPDDREQVDQAYQRTVNDHVSLDIAYRIVRGDNTVRWIQDTADIVCDESGSVARIVGVTADITDRKHAEDSLRESEERFRTMADGLPLIVWVHDAHGKQQFVNKTFCEYFGVSLDEMRNERWQMLTHPDSGKAYIEEFLACARDHRPFHAKVQVKNAAGEWRWIESWGRPRFSSSGVFLGFVGTSADITERTKAEQELTLARAEAENRAAEMESLLSSIADGVTLLDDQGKVVYMNEAGRKILAPPENSTISNNEAGTEVFSLDGEPLSLEDTATQRALRGETVTGTRYAVKFPWGTTRVLGITASPVRNAQGHVTGATSVFRDISDQVDYEKQREELFEREHRIAEVLQSAILPPNVPDAIAGYRIAVRYRPALREAEIGGDFYDVFEIDESKIGILIGDVAGKGLAAAIRVAATRHAVRAYAHIDPRPAQVITLTNESLCKDANNESSMVTVFFGVLDVVDGTLCYTSAGHEPPIVSCVSGTCEELKLGGLPVGVFHGISYTQATRQIDPGDLVVLVTDGITEARTPDHDLFGKDRLKDYVQCNRNSMPDDIASGILDIATSHTDGELQDDVAIVVFSAPSAGKEQI